MITFRVKLANIPLEVSAACKSTRNFCKDYLTDEEPLFSVTVTEADIEKMREQDIRTALAEGREPYPASDSHLETLALASVVLEKLLSRGVLLFHGAVMECEGKAYLFTALSGTGKTTHCRLWLDHIPGCHILNGDKPLLLFRDGRVFVCGSPWKGKEGYGVNEILPLEGLCLLGRDQTNHIEEITLKEAFSPLMKQCHIPDGTENLKAALALIRQLAGVRMYRLGCNMEPEAARVSYEGMARQ